jgi:hypothetical protein
MDIKLNRAGKRAVEKSGQVNRVFEYKKGNTNLNFTLRVDAKDKSTDLKDFAELLETALADVREEIATK